MFLDDIRIELWLPPRMNPFCQTLPTLTAELLFGVVSYNTYFLYCYCHLIDTPFFHFKTILHLK